MLPTPPPLLATIVPLPLYSDSVDPVSFASALLAYRQGELSTKDRQYTSRELSLHSFPIQVQLKAVEDLAPDCTVPPSLLIPNLALVLAQHSSSTPSQPHAGTFTPLAHRITTPKTSTRRTNASHQRPSSTPTRSHSFRQREDDIQCVACCTWGHSASRCSSLAKAALLQTYILANPSHAENTATAWRTLHSMNHRHAIACHQPSTPPS